MINLDTQQTAKPFSIAVLSSRMKGPGGYYNIGNFIGLVSGLALQILSMRSVEGTSSNFVDAVTIYFVGSPGATALTFAMLVFFGAGELYHRAWEKAGDAPDEWLNRWADFVSAVGALLLAVSLAYFGDIFLAITSTILLAGGKFGSALGPAQGWPVRVEGMGRGATTGSLKFDLFRMAVVLSRVPAMCSLIFGLAFAALSGSDIGLGEAQAAILLFCVALWTRADVLLARSASKAPREAEVQ